MSLMSINYFGYAIYNVTVEESIVNLLRYDLRYQKWMRMPLLQLI